MLALLTRYFYRDSEGNIVRISLMIKDSVVKLFRSTTMALVDSADNSEALEMLYAAREKEEQYVNGYQGI